MKWYGKDKEEKLKNKTEFVSFLISKSKSQHSQEQSGTDPFLQSE